MADDDVYVPEAPLARAKVREAKLKQPDESWYEYMSKKLAPITQGIGAAASGSFRALGPLKQGLDPTGDWLASQMSRPVTSTDYSSEAGPTYEFGDPAITPLQNKERREAREAANPRATRAGEGTAALARDAYLYLNPAVRPYVSSAKAINTMAGGGLLSTVSQALDEYSKAVYGGHDVDPVDVGIRLGAAGTGGMAGATVAAAGARRTPVAHEMSAVPGGPLTPAQNELVTQAQARAHAQGDTAPDLAQLMRMTGDEALIRRAADVEGMYRRAKTVDIPEGDIGQFGPAGANRLSGRLTTQPKDGQASVVPDVLSQIHTRSEPGGFYSNVDRLAADLANAERVLTRRNADQRGTPVTDIIPPAGSVPPRVGSAKQRLYDQAVEAQRAPQTTMPPGQAGPPRPGYIPEAQARADVGSPNQLRFWNELLPTLGTTDRAAAEAALASITRASNPPRPGLTGTGPPGIGSAFRDRAAAQGRLNEHGETQRAIGESYPYTPGEPPKLTVSAPPFLTKGAKFGLEWHPQGQATRGTTQSFQDPTVAAAGVGRKSPAELWAAFAGSELGSTLFARLAQAQLGTDKDHYNRPDIIVRPSR